MTVHRREEGDRSMRGPANRAPTLAELVQLRLSRRDTLKAGLVASAVAMAAPLARHVGTSAVAAQAAEPAGGLSFTAIAPSTADRVVVAEGYRVQPLLSWGDPLFAGTPGLNLERQTAAIQERQFGFNNDFVAFLPLPMGSGNPSEGLLWVNHEYTDGRMMFPRYEVGRPTSEQAAIEMAAHGASVVHIRRAADGTWSVVPDSSYTRRLTATTPMKVTGAAAGAGLLRTSTDPTGTTVVGTINNCGGGVTPWGTVLTAEENFQNYFGNLAGLSADDARAALHERYGVTRQASRYGWEQYHPRFDVAREPNEPFRHGWIVEVDPYDPTSQPAKRTALGRFRHEAATVVIAPDGRVVAYSGDDERFDYVYKFVSDGHYDPANRAANLQLLEAGTLYVARFDADGAGTWLPLVAGEGPLVAANGFPSQAEVLILPRQAADLLGATPMDRPEDIETNPVSGKVYAAMTSNNQRGTAGRPAADAANPRADNRWGHIIEWTEDGNDPTATTFRWDVFMLCGEPSDPSTYFAGFPRDQVSAIASPDNIAFDQRGNLWIATDGQEDSLKVGDAVHAVPTDGPARGYLKQFLSSVPGSEVASLNFSPDDTALFVSIQHPGEGGTLAQPTSHWPNDPARPTVIVVTREGGGPLGA